MGSKGFRESPEKHRQTHDTPPRHERKAAEEGALLVEAPPPVNAARAGIGRLRGIAGSAPARAGGRARACYVGGMQAFPSRRNARVSAALLRVAALALPLAGCAAGDYPSLDQRPAERESPRESGTIAPAAPIAAPESVTAPADLAHLLASAQAAHAAFLAARPAAAARVAAARDAAPASEPWAAAAESLSALAATRAPTVAALATLERLHADDTLDHALADGASATPRADAVAITAARDEVAAIAEGERADLAQLNAGLKD